MYGEHVTMAQAGIVTAFSMLMTFSVLAIISLFTILLGKIINGDFKKKETKAAPVAEPAEAVAPKEENNIPLAVIAAAVAAVSNGKSSQLVVRSIKRISENSTAWTERAKINAVSKGL